jgi:outer membrane biogenesis lipoprotein LolB
MKFLILLSLTLFLSACASHEARDPASVDKPDVSRGVNADYFGGSFR